MMRSQHNDKQKRIEEELKGFEDFLRYRRKRNGKHIKKPLSESTIREYLGFVNRMVDRIGIDHNSEDIKNYYEKVLKEKNTNNGLVAICVALNHWCEYKSFDFRLPLHYVNEVPIEVLIESEMDRIINTTHKDDDLLFYSLFLTLRETAQRIDDILATNISDLDLENLRINMVIRKLGSIKHTALISAKLAKALRTYINRQRLKPKNGSDALWISKHRKRINGYTVNTNLKKYAVLAKVRKRVYPHIFRHSAVTIAMEKGMPPKTIMEMYKIKNIQTLARYSHPSDEHMRAEFNRVMSGQNDGHRTTKGFNIPEEPSLLKETQEQAPRSDSKDDNGKNRGRLRSRLEEAYVLGNIDRERYEEGLRRIETLAEIDISDEKIEQSNEKLI